MKSFILTKKEWFYLFSLLSIYLILLGFRGFLFAANDVVDVMSYAKYLNDPSLFPYDFYIQNIAHTLPNERIVFSGFLSLFGNSIAWLSLFLHALTSMFLLAGIHQLARLYIKSTFLAWLVPLFLFGPLYGIGVGDCEIYYNMFIASLAAKSISIWAIYYFLKAQNSTAYILLIPVTFIHPTVGAQLFLIFSASSFIRYLVFKKKFFNRGMFIYILTGVSWLILLQVRIYAESNLSVSGIFEIFEFRLAHHFFPDYFDPKDWLISLALIILSLFFYVGKNHTSSWILLAVTSAGMIIYTLSMSYFPLEIILSSQWFKTYIWIELFGIIALISLGEKFMGRWFKTLPLEKYLTSILWLSAMVVFISIHVDGNIISNKRHDFFYLQAVSSEADIALQAKENTNKEAIFIVPMHFTEFKYYSERSLFIDYKSVVHRKDALPEWYRRIQLTYGLDIKDRRQGYDLYKKGRDHYFHITLEDLEGFKKEGIQYMVSFANQDLNLPVLASNEDYILYELYK